MSGRPWGDVPQHNRIAGGNHPPRPDQLLQPQSRSGVGPAPQNTVFIGRLAIIFGTGAGTGLFVYNGTPKHGNPPILAITTASSDAYGNPVNPSAITDSGMPILAYSGPAAAGNLLFSQAGANGTDGFGNAYLGGVVTYFELEPGYWVATQFGFGLSGLATYFAASEAGPWSTIDSSSHTMPSMTVTFFSGVPYFTFDTSVAIESVIVGESAALNLQFIGGSDGNTYQTGRLSLVVPSAQTITSASNTPINGISAAIQPGKYRVSGVIFCFQGGAAFGQNVGFSGPAITAARIFTNWMNDTGGGTVNGGSITTLTTQGSPAYAATTNFYLIFDGVIEFSSAGTFQMVAAEGTATHQFSINRDSYCDLMPV